MTERDVTLPPITRDEYRHLMRLLGAAAGDIGPRSLGVGLTAQGVIELRARFTLADPNRRAYNPSVANV